MIFRYDSNDYFIYILLNYTRFIYDDDDDDDDDDNIIIFIIIIIIININWIIIQIIQIN